MSLADNALTDYATVAADVGLSGGADQLLVERLINFASGALKRYCNRPLAYLAGIAEPLRMEGGPRLLVTRTPVLALGQITVDDGVLDATDYYLEDAFAGFIWRDAGWPWSALMRAGRTELNFTQDQEPLSEKTRTTVAYAGGYITSPQAYGASVWPAAGKTVAVGTLMKPASQPTQLWVATPVDPKQPMVTGSVEPSWPASPNAARLAKQALVGGETETDGNVLWTYLGSCGAAGAPGTAVLDSGAGVPPDLEQACILTVKAHYRERADNPNVKSESLLGASITYDRTKLLPPQAMSLADQFRRTV